MASFGGRACSYGLSQEAGMILWLSQEVCESPFAAPGAFAICVSEMMLSVLWRPRYRLCPLVLQTPTLGCSWDQQFPSFPRHYHHEEMRSQGTERETGAAQVTCHHACWYFNTLAVGKDCETSKQFLSRNPHNAGNAALGFNEQ